MNERDNEHEIQTINQCTGLVKVSILSNNCYMQSDTRLAYIVSQKIAAMYTGLKHQETLQASLATQNLNSPVFSSSISTIITEPPRKHTRSAVRLTRHLTLPMTSVGFLRGENLSISLSPLELYGLDNTLKLL